MSGAIPIARLLLVVSVVNATNGVGFNMMIGVARAGPLLAINIVSLILKLGLSLAFAPSLGLFGVVLGTLVAQLLVWYPYSRLYLNTLGASWRGYFLRAILRPLVAAVILGAILAGASGAFEPSGLGQTLASAAVAGVIYAALLYSVGLEGIERRKVLHWASRWRAVLG